MNQSHCGKGILLGLLLLLCTAGCSKGPRLVEVTGTVQHQGKAVLGGSLWFHSTDPSYKGEKSSCLLGEEGTFVMKTYPWGQGVPVGEYKITLDPALAGRLLKPEYGDVNKTPWSIEVTSEGVIGKELVVK
jgi:hypothetical protein